MPRKPRLNAKARPADRYAAPGERIAEFSFPEAADGRGNVPGGLISLRYREGGAPLVQLYQVEGCEVSAPTRERDILRELIAKAHAYYDRNITKPDGDGEDDRPPDGDDFNELFELIERAELKLNAG